MPQSVKDAIHDIVVNQNSQSEGTAKGYVKALEEKCAASWSVIEQSEQSWLVDEVKLPKGLVVQLMKMAKQKATLPYPDLPPGGYPEPGKLDDHLSQIGKVTPLGEAVVKPGEPPAFDMLTTQEWMTVFRNCNVLKAMTMRELETPGKSILVPPNNAEAIRNLLQVSQGSAEYSSGLSFDRNFNKHAEKCDFGAFAKVSCPFMSANVDYKRQTETQTVKMGMQMTQTVRYLLKIGTLYFRPGINVPVDVDENDKFRVEPDLDKSFRTLMTIPLGEEHLKDYEDKLTQKYAEWGEIVASKVMIGLSLHASKTMQCEQAQQMEAAKEAIKSAMKGSNDCIVNFEGGGHYQTYTCKEFASSHSKEMSTWESIGGVGCSDPQGLEQHRGNSKGWRCINYQEFHPIKDFLKKDIRDRMTAWEKLAAKASAPPTVPDLFCEGTYSLSTSKWPDCYLCVESDDDFKRVGGFCRREHAELPPCCKITLQKVPNNPGYWLLSFLCSQLLFGQLRWDGHYIGMDSRAAVQWFLGSPGPRCYWNIQKNPLKDGTYRFVSMRWPSRYTYMTSHWLGYVNSWSGDPGEQGWWIMTKIA